MIKDNPVRVYFTAMYELQKEKMESQRSVALNCIERAKMLIDSQKEYLKQELESLRNKDYSEAERDIEKQ